MKSFLSAFAGTGDGTIGTGWWILDGQTDRSGGVPGVSIATTRTVTSAGDSGAGSLRAVTGAAESGDTVTFDSTVATVTLASTLSIGTAITLDGAAGRNGGSDTIISGAGPLVIAGDVTLAGLTFGGSLLVRNNGSVTQAGALRLGESDISTARITNAAGKVWRLEDNASITSASGGFFNNAGTILKEGAGDALIGARFGNISGQSGAIDIRQGRLAFGAGVGSSAAIDLQNQAIQGAGTLQLSGADALMGTGTTLTVASFVAALSNVRLTANVTYSGTFAFVFGVLDLGSYQFTLGGTFTPAFAAVIGTGKLINTGSFIAGSADSPAGIALYIGGSALFRNNGSVAQSSMISLGDGSGGSAQITNAAGKTWSIDTNAGIVAGNSLATFNNGGGRLQKTGGSGTSIIGVNFTNLAGTAATISIASGILNFTGATNNFVADAISGAGTFAIGGGGTSTIGAGTSITTASWTIAKVGTTVTLGETLAYAGNFSQTNQTTLNLGANTLTLSGPALFNLGPGGSPIIAGTGKLITNGADSLGAFTLGGAVLLRNNGGVTQTGTITLGDSTNGSAQVTNAAGKSWVLTGDVGIVKGSTAALFNTGGGGFSKAGGTGVSTIGVNVTNLNGTASQIEVASGTLDFAGTVSGSQAFKIDAGRTLQFDSSVATGSAVIFAGAGGTLRLNDAQDFKGAITGFGGGQSLDLASIGYTNPGTTLVYAGSTLTVAAGGKTASLAIGTGYTPTSFHLANDTHGGSLVTYG